MALAAKAMVSKSKRVMIVDWVRKFKVLEEETSVSKLNSFSSPSHQDIHHSNGTQQIFYDNPNVLHLSIHRYDNGTFFPGTGRPEEVRHYRAILDVSTLYLRGGRQLPHVRIGSCAWERGYVRGSIEMNPSPTGWVWCRAGVQCQHCFLGYPELSGCYK